MAIKIENKLPRVKSFNTRHDIREFRAAVKFLKPGQSFVVDYFTAYHRSILSTAKYFLGKPFYTRKEGNKTRVALDD